MKNVQFIYSFYAVLLITFLGSCNIRESQSRESSESSSSKRIILGYVAGGLDWRKHEIAAEKLTHINYAFAAISEKGVLNDPREKDSLNLVHLNTLKKRNKDLKILISVGGWGAEGFSDAALNEETRAKFTNSCLSFMKRFQLDGVDLDWEYPGQPGAGNVYRPEDKENFTWMLKSLREALDVESKKDGKDEGNYYLLTIASGGDAEYLRHTKLGEAQKYLDFINIMTYDLYHGNDTVTGHHSPLYQSKLEKQSRNSSDMAVKGHVEAGVPVNKIVLGVPFYARGWKEVNDVDNGLYQPASGPHFTIDYDTLKTSYINKNGFVRHWDDDAKAPFLWNPETKSFLSYADEESFKNKTEYIKSEGLRGVMFWEYKHDLMDGALLEALYQGLQ